MELKPCPFCGAEPLTQEHEPHTHSGPLKAMGIPDHPGSWTIECPTDGCCGMIGSTLDEVATAWNRRAAPAQAEPSDDAKDAARYRYLRGRSFGAEPKDGMRFMLAVPEPAPNEWRIHSVRDEKMDAAIDAAIQRRS